MHEAYARLATGQAKSIRNLYGIGLDHCTFAKAFYADVLTYNTQCYTCS
jgi:hypothetical protein